jgi:serine/threonine-protein kinase mTOR
VTHERLGGLVAIDRLLDIESDEAIEPRAVKHYRLYQYVKSGLQCNDINLMITASKTLGRVLEIGGNFGDAFMPAEIPRLLESLNNDRDLSRYAAVLILRALARFSVAQFYPFVGNVLERIWIPLRDSRVVVREGAADLLASCLDIVGNRPGQSHAVNHAKILNQAVAGFKSTSVDVVHGSLLAYRELLLHAGMVSELQKAISSSPAHLTRS